MTESSKITHNHINTYFYESMFHGLAILVLAHGYIAAKHGVEIAGVDINARWWRLPTKGNCTSSSRVWRICWRRYWPPDISQGVHRASGERRLFHGGTHSLQGDHEPDVSFVESATRMVLPFVEGGDLYVIESTSPVGTTERMARLIFSGTAGAGGQDLYRLLPGAGASG